MLACLLTKIAEPAPPYALPLQSGQQTSILSSNNSLSAAGGLSCGRLDEEAISFSFAVSKENRYIVTGRAIEIPQLAQTKPHECQSICSLSSQRLIAIEAVCFM